MLLYSDLYNATQLGNELGVNLFFEDNKDKKINFSTFSAHDLFQIYFKENNVKFYYYNFPNSILGTTVKDESETTIAVREGLVANRKNFTIAHEIGHIEMHLKTKEDMYFDTGSTFKESSSISIIEKEANAFAAGLLIPRSALLMNLYTFNTASKTAAILNVSKQVLYWRLVNYVHEEVNYHFYVRKLIGDYFKCTDSSEVAESDLINILKVSGVKVMYDL